MTFAGLARSMRVRVDRGDEAPWAPRAETAALEERVALVLLLATLVIAFVVDSGRLVFSDFLLGDAAYHRGVAYTMQGGDLQGQGPYPGFISYYGGLYPLVLGAASALLDVDFDTALSVISWFATVLWPLALLLLGRRLWPEDALTATAFAAVGTFAAPLTLEPGALWVESVLASSHDFWPLLPRDLALSGVVLAAWAVLSPRAAVRIAGTGMLIALTILVQAQIGAILILLVLAWAAWVALRERQPRPIGEAVAAAGTAALLTAWWWIPRLDAALRSGRLLLADHPGREPLRLDAVGWVAAFGLAGILALLALAMGARQLLRGRASALLLVWLAALLPLVIVDRAGLAMGLFSERRIWLLASIPLMGLATLGLLALVRGIRQPVLVGLLLLVLALPTALVGLETVRLVRTWAGATPRDHVFEPQVWRPIWRAMNGAVRSEGSHVVITYDAYATWLWSKSGAQVVSLYLPGFFKLGFDPAALTGAGFEQRKQLLERAFSGGRATVCELARGQGADSLLLDWHEGSVGTYDTTPASAYRVGPDEMDIESIHREVAPGIRYVDDGQADRLEMDAGASYPLPWQAPDASAIAIEFRFSGARAPGPPLRLTTASGTLDLEAAGDRRLTRAVAELADGLDGPATLTALQPLELIRVTAFEPSPVERPDGPSEIGIDEFCGPAGS